jgi:hypothetical protein
MALEGSERNKTASSVRSRLVGRREGIIEVLFLRDGGIERPALTSLTWTPTAGVGI